MWDDDDQYSDTHITENEIGTENFQRYRQMSPESQKKARKRYHHVLKSMNGSDEVDMKSESAVTRFLFSGSHDPSKESIFDILKMAFLLASLMYMCYYLANLETSDDFDILEKIRNEKIYASE